ncbi:MAG: 2-oxoglutarate dehydrogenase E1 component [Deltaproteobacteria bacterium]|nr:2-oxoglutarate dehydrogenase E1 component [Deltaproteobacteria bacterium]
MSFPTAWNSEFVEEQYRLWKADPSKIPQDWQFFFQGFELGQLREPVVGEAYDEEQLAAQFRVDALVYRYRDLGHLLACLDPLSACPTDHPYLNMATFGLTDEDLDREFYCDIFTGSSRARLRRIVEVLRETYCRSVGVEYMHLQDPEERRWLQQRMETSRNRPSMKPQEKLRILHRLYQATLFEQFLHRRYPGQTRFSLEGAESIIPMLADLVRHVAEQGCQEIILGMAHRGRLNVQTNILGKSFRDIFCEFESSYDPDSIVGSGDVKYHNGYLGDLRLDGNRKVRILLVNNPSHLESVNPVVEGFARARKEILQAADRAAVLPLLIHGDASFAGQGIVAETLNMSQLPGYSTGGTIHIIINNQIGYTTLPEDARSTRYSTDIAKMLMVPVFHVHGESPEQVLHVTRLAADYRQEFGKDVVIDVVCYRRYGHNEGDEPYFTQPLMYERIKQRPSLAAIYSEQLRRDKIIDEQEVNRLKQEINSSLEAAYQARECVFPSVKFYENWDNIQADYSHQPVDTTVSEARLLELARKLNTVPRGFNLHPKLSELLKRRLKAVEAGDSIDWANAESLAFASLLMEQIPVRLSGQDCRRGTFSQRHSVLVDMKTGERYIPLNSLSSEQASFSVYDSSLSEAAILGFEYGYSLAQPHGLTAWEAQFGDFVNNAQAIIDLYIASGEAKWQRLSGLVMLLPHGLDGLGPEHSSARLERFLQLCAADNLQVCNLTTPAQYFHMLRRQVKAPYRKPLVIMAPKSLLRHPRAVSPRSELSGGTFHKVLDDTVTASRVKRVLFCSGKIYYELLARREEQKRTDLTFVRVEQLYPFPEEELAAVVRRYRKAVEWLWVQEEPENMGAWTFVRPRLARLAGRHIGYIGRAAAASPAPGFHTVYKSEQEAVLAEAVGAPVSAAGKHKSKE